MARTIIVVTDECCCQDCPGECPAACSTTTSCTVQYTVDTTAHGFDDTECSCAHGIFSIYKVCASADPTTATTGDANCCWISTGLVGSGGCKTEAALPTNHPCACCISVDPFNDCDVLFGYNSQNPISITLTCILNPSPSDPPCDTYVWKLEFSTGSMPAYKSDCVVIDGEGSTGTASAGGEADDDHRGCASTECGPGNGAYWSGYKAVGTSDCPPDGTWVLTKDGGSSGVCHTPGPTTTGDHATECETRNAGLGSDTDGSDLTITLTAIP